ncbi:MAG: hypothetical protein Q9227_006016 [Pyrenula ochraceoflavens]
MKDTPSIEASCETMWHRLNEFLGGLPPLLRQLRIICESNTPLDTSLPYELAQEIATQLCRYGTQLDLKAFKDGTVTAIPWPKEEGILPPPPHIECHFNGYDTCPHQQQMLSFSSIAAARTLTTYWLCKILMNLLVARLDPQSQYLYLDRQKYALPYLEGDSNILDDAFSPILRNYVPMFGQRLAAETAHYASMIRASVPYFDTFRPLAVANIAFPLKVASAVSTTEEKEWMAANLNEMFDKLAIRFFVVYPSPACSSLSPEDLENLDPDLAVR